MIRPCNPVLLSAYQCGPGMGSVSQIGWEWYSRLSRRVPVTLVTHVRNRKALEDAGAPLPDSEVLYIDTEWIARPLYRTASRLFPRSQHAVFLMSSLDYLFFDRASVRALRLRPKDRRNWSVAHAVTPVSPSARNTLHRLGLPVVLGPLNGGLDFLPAFKEVKRQESAWLSPLRKIARWADSGGRAMSSASVILAANRATVNALPLASRSRCLPMLENGVDLERFRPRPMPPVLPGGTPFTVLFAGRLVPSKTLPLLLEAVRRIRGQFPLKLEIAGDGPMRTAWEEEARNLGIADLAHFHGATTLDRVAGLMKECHVFCLPSVRESGGAVLLEAMATARPVIAVAHGGPKDVVDDQVGCAVPADDSETVIRGIAEALRDASCRPEIWRRKGEEGRRRAERLYSWEAKISQAFDIYGTLARARESRAALSSS